VRRTDLGKVVLLRTVPEVHQVRGVMSARQPPRPELGWYFQQDPSVHQVGELGTDAVDRNAARPPTQPVEELSG
jgi:hypothetical protein